MATDQGYIDFIIDQCKEAGTITYRKMFGEYALYCGTKVFALVCNNQLFLKKTEAGRAVIVYPVEAPAYKGAKNSFLIEDQVEDAEWISHLVSVTVQELPEPKPKKKRI